jgi:signal recognition particle subunit SRP19
LKDYDHIIIWLDYFNKHLSRKKGRRISKDISVYDPSMNDLIESANELGFQIAEDNINRNARYPRRAFVKSGYVMIERKDFKKNDIIEMVGKRMIEKRQKMHK